MRLSLLLAVLLLAACHQQPNATPPASAPPNQGPTLPPGHPGVRAFTATAVTLPIGLFAAHDTNLGVTFYETTFSVSPFMGSLTVPLFSGQAFRGGRTYDVSYDTVTHQISIQDHDDPSLASGVWVLVFSFG